MKICQTVKETRRVVLEARNDGKTISLVPTMGFLHEGHLSLVDAAKARSSFVVLTIFVNPLQFGPSEDFDVYPRDRDRDVELARARGVDLLFIPEPGEMYPEETLTFVEVTRITDGLCGQRRPGHFRGVMTVVAKLFNIIEPDFSIFGQKDAQQALAIRRMALDLNFRGEVLIAPTVRESDGLAMSSRNIYLKGEERGRAALLYRSLLEAKQKIEGGEREVSRVKDAMMQVLTSCGGVDIDYLSITDTRYLEELETINGEILVAIAAFIGGTRLIDNMIFTVR